MATLMTMTVITMAPGSDNVKLPQYGLLLITTSDTGRVNISVSASTTAVSRSRPNSAYKSPPKNDTIYQSIDFGRIEMNHEGGRTD